MPARYTLRRLGGALAALCLLLGGSTVPAAAVGTSAAAAVLLEAESGRVLYASAAEQPMGIASTTKIMTALAALRHYDPGETVRVGREPTLVEGSSMYLREGEELTVETLLYGLLLASGNDAAEALAAHCGSRERFVGWMNELAAELGMSGSSFANPSGLDEEGHYSTAYDMALLAAAALQEPTLARIVSTRSVTIGTRTLTNHNKLLYRVEGCIGLKTGYTRASGRTLVSCAERDGVRLIAVTLQDGNDWADHAALYEYGFAALARERAGEEVLAGLPAGEAEPETAPAGLARWLERGRALL